MAGNIKLLFVDDEERFLQTLSKRLSLRGFDVTSASDGQAALAAAEAGEFDVAVVDLKMPGLDGEEVLRRIKKRHPLTEVVILTGHGSIESAERCSKIGSFRYLQKPAETEALIEILKEAYQERIQKKLQLDQRRLEELLNIAGGESPLGIMRRLKELDEKYGKG